MNLESTVNNIGEYTTQIIHFKCGEKRTFTGIVSSKIKQGQFTKLWLKNGSIVMVNDKNVLCVEVFSE